MKVLSEEEKQKFVDCVIEWKKNTSKGWDFLQSHAYYESCFAIFVQKMKNRIFTICLKYSVRRKIKSNSKADATEFLQQKKTGSGLRIQKISLRGKTSAK